MESRHQPLPLQMQRAQAVRLVARQLDRDTEQLLNFMGVHGLLDFPPREFFLEQPGAEFDAGQMLA